MRRPGTARVIGPAAGFSPGLLRPQSQPATVYDRAVAGDAPRGTLLDVERGSPMSDRRERTVRALFEHPLIDVTWSRYEPGERGPDPHVHHEHVDAFYVVEGELVFGLGAELREVRAPAGTFVLVPADVIHTFGNASGATARWLNFHAPSTGFIANLRGGESASTATTRRPTAAAAGEAVVVAAGAGERLERPTPDADDHRRQPQLSALELAVDPGFTVDPHTHADEVDSFFVLDGEIEFTVGGQPITAGAGHVGLGAAAAPATASATRAARRARLLNVHAPEEGFVAGIRG